MRAQPFIFLVLFLTTLACGTAGDSPEPDDSDGNTGICGSERNQVTVDFTATIWHAQNGVAIEGAELTCLGEDSPRATSDAQGIVSFTLETYESPICGYEDCDIIKIHVPNSSLLDQELSFAQANGATIEMLFGGD